MKHIVFAAALLTFLPASWAQDTVKPEKPLPSQSESASKSAKFATVKAADSALKDAVPAKDLAGAKKLVGKPGKFVGVVAKVYSPQTNGIVILNFDKNYRTALTAVLRPTDFAKFPDMKSLEGKKVLVSGKFVAYKEQVEIELTDPAQIKIVQE